MIDGKYSLKEIEKKFGVPYRTLYYWIKTGKLFAEQGVNKFRKKEWYVSENDWLDIPTFIRNRYKLKKIKKTL